MNSRKRSSSRGAFTLIELLVVIAIISLLVGLLLPSLSSARDSARDLKCKINMKQVGLGIQMYLDDQKDPVWFKHRLSGSGPYAHYLVTRALTDYMGGDGKSEVYKCPRAGSGTSVVDPAVNTILNSGGRFFVDPTDPALPNVADAKNYTEYWFNDSILMAGLPMRRNQTYLPAVVFMADAYDEVPRHSAKKSTGNRAAGFDRSRLNEIYMLFGDQSIGAFTWLKALAVPPAKDKFNIPGVFYDWGLYTNPANPQP